MKPTGLMALSQCPQCVCFNLLKSARILTRFYDAALQPTGIQGTQFSLLSVLHHAGELPITELAEKLGIERTTVTRNLRTLIGRGYIVVDQGKDGRTKSVKLTSAGQDMLVKALPFWEQAQQKVVDGLGPARFKGLLKELAAIRALTR
jgi:DNA-binding MarR family transcriptional regulator